MMKQPLHLVLLLMIFILSYPAATQAQTFTETTPFQEVDTYDDTLKYWLHNLPAGAWGTATIKVYFEGDFGDNVEFIDFYGPNDVYIGTAGPYASKDDCDGLDSVTLSFPASALAALLPADSILVRGLSTNDVDPGACGISQASITASYNYCQFGVPQQIASLSFADSSVCPLDGAVALTGVPANGTFTGTNITGSTFNPAGLSAGLYNITYTATDGIGCTTSTTKSILVLRSPNAADQVVCPGATATLSTTGGWENLVWATSSNLSTILDTAQSFTTPSIYTTTTYYVAGVVNINMFKVDTILDTNNFITDHDSYTGDDRGGIAVTENHVYIVGDNNTVRYNTDYTNPVSLPMQDGLFSDLSTGRLYTLWNGTTNPNDASSFTVTSLMELDSNLANTNNAVQLTSPVPMMGDNGIFVGTGFIVLYDGNANNFYAVNINSGFVEDLGNANSLPLYGSENWSDWGVAEFDGNDYYVLYRDYNDANIYRMNITTGDVTTVGVFNDLSDLSSFTVSPWNNRWYFHYEGGGQFGGSDETGGYADAAMTITPLGATIGCASEITLTVNTVSLGDDTIICEGTSVVLFAGTGYTQYAWNGTVTNFNAVSATDQGVYTVAVLDNDGCTLRDTVNVIVNDAPNASIDLGGSFIYCSSAAAITLSATPANGTFSGTGVTSGSFNPATAGVGVHEITYTVTDNNGCVGTAMDYLVVENCTGIDEVDANIVSVFPNPSTGVVNVQFSNPTSNATAVVYDMQGREVYRNDAGAMNNNVMTINLSHVGSGMYQLRISANGNTSTTRLVVQQ